MHVLDALEGVWILTVFLLAFLWVPIQLFRRPAHSDLLLRCAGNFARALLGITAAVLLLVRLKTLNSATVTALLASTIAATWLLRNAGSPKVLGRRLQTAAIGTLQWFEMRSFRRYLLRREHRKAPQSKSADSRISQSFQLVQRRELLVASLAIVLVLTGVLGAEHAVRELRLNQPGQYDILLRARQLILNQVGSGPLVFPAVIATVSLLSAREPMQVTRFLVPIVAILTVLAIGLLLRTCMRCGVACVVGMYCLGAAAFPPVTDGPLVAVSLTRKLESLIRVSPASFRASPEIGLGVLFVLLALALLADWYKNTRRWDPLVDVACCLVLVGLVSRSLLLLLVVVSAALLLQPVVGLVLLVVASYGLAAYAALMPNTMDLSIVRAVLPIAAAVGIACLFALAQVVLVPLAGRATEPILLVASLVVVAIWFPPHQWPSQCLEYESAARVTQRIAEGFPRQKWAVAAPVEQLAETFGLGGHEDLAEFLEKYRDQVSNSDFRFPDARDDMFVYVEKRPFQIFSREPDTPSFPVLADATYRNYRSPGGRASLESAALQLCESYRKAHSDTDIFFEDEDLRVYHIHQGSRETKKDGARKGS